MSDQIHIPPENKLFTVAQSREADRFTIDEFGIDGFTLMEQAASGAAEIIRKEAGISKKGLFICGKGNNGGDALAAARYLSEQSGHSIHVWMCMGSENLSADAEKNLKLIHKLIGYQSNITILDSSPFNDPEENNYDYIVDGIFGSGLTDDVREPVAGIIEKINDSGLPVFAMDIPSGLDADSGLIRGVCVQGSHTITFGTVKIGFYLNGSDKVTGQVHLVPLPFPEYGMTYDSVLINNRLESTIPAIDRKAEHKYDDGVVHIIAGSKGLTGAAIMAAKSAWKSGAGAVILYTTENLLQIYEKNLPQIIKKTVGNPSDDQFKPGHAEEILSSVLSKPGVVLAGPGMGTDSETRKFLTELLERYSGPLILDADALAGFDELKDISSEQKKNWILTPHIGEAVNYLGMVFDKENDSERLAAAVKFSEKFECSIVLKGNPTFLIHYGNKKYITGYDTSPFTRAGFGDVLSGTISANLGITHNIPVSVVQALLSGHQKYNQLAEDDVFGPEHLT
ncbi:NAD(P)H-hydrate dehydratase [Rhodohalobacter mucosus]|nr:NAD(P)H-hydrate dehydratase [Rhodohalobacter mucosus]